ARSKDFARLGQITATKLNLIYMKHLVFGLVFLFGCATASKPLTSTEPAKSSTDPFADIMALLGTEEPKKPLTDPFADIMALLGTEEPKNPLTGPCLINECTFDI